MIHYIQSLFPSYRTLSFIQFQLPSRLVATGFAVTALAVAAFACSIFEKDCIECQAIDTGIEDKDTEVEQAPS
jgi:hypothetical protein